MRSVNEYIVICIDWLLLIKLNVFFMCDFIASATLIWLLIGVGIFSHLTIRFWESRSGSRTILDLLSHPY